MQYILHLLMDLFFFFVNWFFIDILLTYMGEILEPEEHMNFPGNQAQTRETIAQETGN